MQRRWRLAQGGIAMLLLVLLVACSSAGNKSGNATTGTASTQRQGSLASATAATTQQLVVPTSSGGKPGRGPIIITSPTPAPGGKPGSQQIALADRTLLINSVTRQHAAGANSTLITLDLTVRNTSAGAIGNLPTYFQLMGSGGDAFSYQTNSSDSFYGAIAAYAARAGVIVFQVPAAAASGLRLLYRPEVATEIAIIPLQIS